MATAVNHLPECELSTGVYDDRADCICDALRACEQRLIREGRTRGSGVWHDGYELGFDDGVVAAEAIITDAWSNHLESEWDEFMQEIQGRVDALRVKHSGGPTFGLEHL